MIEMFCEYLHVNFFWLYFIIMSQTSFGVNLGSLVAWISRNFLLEIGV